MAKVYLDQDMQHSDWKYKENEPARKALLEARSLQQEVMEICRESQEDRFESERLVSAEISYQIGKLMEEREGNI
jgi:hypothetical protein